MTHDHPVPDPAARLTAAAPFLEAVSSPTLIAVRDAMITDSGATTADEALGAARVLLAAHARELADLVQKRIDQDRERTTGRSSKQDHQHRGGMMTARTVLDRYADDLDALALADAILTGTDQ